MKIHSVNATSKQNKTSNQLQCLGKKKRFLKSQLNQFGTVPGNYDMHNKIDMPRIHRGFIPEKGD